MTAKAQKMDSRINFLYTDSHVAVCEKPSGVLSQRDISGEDGMVELLSAELGGDIFPVHRLDRPVGGLMVFARTQKTAAKLSAAASENGNQADESHGFLKEYLVCVSGAPQESAGVLTDHLYRDRASGKTFAVSSARKGTKPASLSYRLLGSASGASGEPLSLLKIRLHTGRTHQIRAQFATRGMPVAGDGKYGSRVKCAGIALASCRLAFDHPVSGKRMDFRLIPKEHPVFGLFGELLYIQ